MLSSAQGRGGDKGLQSCVWPIVLRGVCPSSRSSFSVLSVTWEPMGDGKKVISLADNHILLWDLQQSSGRAVVSTHEHALQVVHILLSWNADSDSQGSRGCTGGMPTVTPRGLGDGLEEAESCGK